MSYGTQSILSNLLRLEGSRRSGLMSDGGDGGSGGVAGNRTGGGGVVGHDSVGDDGGGGGGCDVGNSFPMLT